MAVHVEWARARPGGPGSFGGALLAGLMVTALLGACRDPADVASEWPPSSVPRDVLLAVPEQVDIDGRSYVLEAELWRDYMPVSPPDGRPLAAVVYVGATDLQDADHGLDVDRVYVVYGEDAREAPVADQDVLQPPPYRIRRIAQGGPKWPTESFVDVIVRVRSPQSGDVLLRASGQRIGRTE